MKLSLKRPEKHPDKVHVKEQPINGDGHIIGVDLGATAVRAAILALGNDGGRPSVTVHGVGSVPIPPGVIVNGVVIERNVVTQALKKLWQLHGFNCEKVILGVANPQVVVRPLEIPNLNAAQRAKALPFQAREIIALPLDEVILDYAQVGAPDAKTGLVSGLLIATPRRPVLTAVDAVERAGLKVARVDLSSFGALRSIADEHLVVQAVIDIGAQLTSIVIHDHGVPRLVRTLARGGQELTEMLAETMGLELHEAELVKWQTGLIGSSAAANALQAGIRPLLAEIRSSINYYRAGNEGGQLEGISLTGGGAALRGLAEALSTQNGVPTGVVTPMLHIDNRHLAAAPGSEQSDQAATAVSIGLAMGAAA